MRKRDKEHYAFEAAVAEEKRLTKRLADRIIDNVNDLSGRNFNTVDVILEVGRVKALREIINW